MTLRVLALVTLPTSGAGNRLRIEQYREPLKAYGIDLAVSPFFDEAAYQILYRPGNTAAKVAGVLRGLGRRLRDIVRASRSGLVLVYRESAPIGPPLIERVLSLLGRRFVFDFDDALFLGPIHPANRRWAWLRHPSRIVETTRRAAVVVTVNDYLARWARTQNPDVFVIPTPVDTTIFRLRPARSPGPFVIGWIGSSTTAPYLHLLDDVFDALAGRADFIVRVVGGSYSHPRVQVDERPWNLSREPEDVASFDVGVLPEPDDEWTKGKGAFKALLYMATGVPVVASRLGVNEGVIGDAGYCVENTQGWVYALLRLAADPDLRIHLGRAGRRRVEERYALGVQVPRLAAILRSAANVGVPPSPS